MPNVGKDSEIVQVTLKKQDVIKANQLRGYGKKLPSPGTNGELYEPTLELEGLGPEMRRRFFLSFELEARIARARAVIKQPLDALDGALEQTK